MNPGIYYDDRGEKSETSHKISDPLKRRSTPEERESLNHSAPTITCKADLEEISGTSMLNAGFYYGLSKGDDVRWYY